MKTLLAAAIALALLAPAAVRAQDAATAPPTFHASMTDKLNLKIVRIDAESRIVTLKHASGDTIQILCGPEVRNFDQLKVGDTVTTEYKEDLAIRIDPNGSFTETTESSSTRAAKGATPHAQFWEKKEVSARISAIDKTAGTATIETRKGEEFTVIPDVPENLDKVKVGDFVVVTQTINRAISVSKPGKSKGTTKKASSKTTTTTKTETK